MPIDLRYFQKKTVQEIEVPLQINALIDLL